MAPSGQELSWSGQWDSSQLDHCAVWLSIVLVWTPQCLGLTGGSEEKTDQTNQSCLQELPSGETIESEEGPLLLKAKEGFWLRCQLLRSCIESQRMLFKP